MKTIRFPIGLLSILLLQLPSAGLAQDFPQSGFLDDYSKLRPAPQLEKIDFVYMSDDFHAKIAAAKAIIIPPPVFFVAADSKYKGINPDDIKVITEGLRQRLIDAFADGYQIASNAGPNTIELRMAMSNIHLKKKKRTPLIGYLPQVYIATSAKRAMFDDFREKVDLRDVIIEAEILDAESGRAVGQIVMLVGDSRNKKRFASWEELDAALNLNAARLRCRFDNAGLPENKRKNCL